MTIRYQCVCMRVCARMYWGGAVHKGLMQGKVIWFNATLVQINEQVSRKNKENLISWPSGTRGYQPLHFLYFSFFCPTVEVGGERKAEKWRREG